MYRWPCSFLTLRHPNLLFFTFYISKTIPRPPLGKAQTALRKKWNTAKTIFNMADGINSRCNVARGSGMTCRWIRSNVPLYWNFTSGFDFVIISTISPQSTCHYAPGCEILSKSDHPRQKKMTSCQCSRWRISAILDFRGPVMGSFKPHVRLPIGLQTIAVNCLVFEKITFFIFFGDRQTD